MRLTRVFVAGSLVPGAAIELPHDTGSHLAKVLRARGGEELVLFNGDGREFSGTIETVRGSRVFTSVGASRSVDRESPLMLTLVQCVPRGDRMDFIVQKATELGIARIVPALSQRSVVRLDSAQALSKQLHWHAVAVNACEQCGRNRLPIVEQPQPLLTFLGQMADATPTEMRLVLEPEVRTQPRSVPTNNAVIAIGPEGGFAPQELQAFELSAFARLGLGPRILRTETAAIAAITVMQARFGDLSVSSDATSPDADA